MKTVEEKAKLEHIEQLKKRFELWGDIPEPAFDIWQIAKHQTLDKQLEIHKRLTRNDSLTVGDITGFIHRMAKLPDTYDGFIREGWDGSDPFIELRQTGVELPSWTLDYLT